MLDVSTKFCGALFYQDSPRSAAAWAVQIMVPIFFTFVTTFFQPRLAENDTNHSFHMKRMDLPLLTLLEVVKLVMGVSAI